MLVVHPYCLFKTILCMIVRPWFGLCLRVMNFGRPHIFVHGLDFILGFWTLVVHPYSSMVGLCLKIMDVIRLAYSSMV